MNATSPNFTKTRSEILNWRGSWGRESRRLNDLQVPFHVQVLQHRKLSYLTFYNSENVFKCFISIDELYKGEKKPNSINLKGTPENWPFDISLSTHCLHLEQCSVPMSRAASTSSRGKDFCSFPPQGPKDKMVGFGVNHFLTCFPPIGDTIIYLISWGKGTMWRSVHWQNHMIYKAFKE